MASPLYLRVCMPIRQTSDADRANNQEPATVFDSTEKTRDFSISPMTCYIPLRTNVRSGPSHLEHVNTFYIGPIADVILLNFSTSVPKNWVFRPMRPVCRPSTLRVHFLCLLNLRQFVVGNRERRIESNWEYEAPRIPSRRETDECAH